MSNGSTSSDNSTNSIPITNHNDSLSFIISSLLHPTTHSEVTPLSSENNSIHSRGDLPIWIPEQREEMGGMKGLRDTIFQHSKSLHLQSASRDPKKVCFCTHSFFIVSNCLLCEVGLYLPLQFKNFYFMGILMPLFPMEITPQEGVTMVNTVAMEIVAMKVLQLWKNYKIIC